MSDAVAMATHLSDNEDVMYVALYSLRRIHLSSISYRHLFFPLFTRGKAACSGNGVLLLSLLSSLL